MSDGSRQAHALESRGGGAGAPNYEKGYAAHICAGSSFFLLGVHRALDISGDCPSPLRMYGRPEPTFDSVRELFSNAAVGRHIDCVVLCRCVVNK